MTAHPPPAESELHDEEHYSYQEAGCYTQLRVKRKSPIIEQQRTNDTLGNIICKAHLTVRSNLHQPVVQVCPIESKDNNRHQKHHKSKLRQGSKDK